MKNPKEEKIYFSIDLAERKGVGLLFKLETITVKGDKVINREQTEANYLPIIMDKIEKEINGKFYAGN